MKSHVELLSFHYKFFVKQFTLTILILRTWIQDSYNVNFTKYFGMVW